MNSGSVLASMAAQAAHRQGKFWDMSEVLYRNMNEQSMEQLLIYAAQIGLDVELFKRDLKDPGIVQLVERDKIEGVRAKVPGTPMLFINGKFFDLRYYEPFLKDVLNEEAERLGGPQPYKEWAYGGLSTNSQSPK
jgi:predicted DsbA family dithiol-disulfide isomerase